MSGAGHRDRRAGAGRRLAGFRRLVGQVLEDADAVVQRDPATSSRAEALLTSPGLHAIAAHRVAHSLWSRPGGRLPARVLGTLSRAVTGVEIHPGATIGRRLVIDHGMGVVIGETAEVGDDVMMYHGVTLGGTISQTVKRHPTVGDRVLLGAGSTVLGNIELASGTAVGAGAVVLKPVPSGQVVGGIPAKPLNSTYELPELPRELAADHWMI
ncbi:serine O-acetyltransferase [Kytococcus aerolatus]|uniref:Serine acetyltransferase n=1 Tax=Kytococcus aerolatus TaxID=592308 RepID=A0A212THP2_9MICO|nr:serine O-acetyltransferase EpsC [Kytococcus aerolatus]SNC65577.1 serine O-acetyltransferase [Kytococcus aerolatus]